MVQVMLQLPGTNLQLPVNIPAETILPALTKYIPKLSLATNAAVTTASSSTVAKQEPQKVDTSLVHMALVSDRDYDNAVRLTGDLLLFVMIY